MRIVETKVYPFTELSAEAKKKALEKFRDVNVDHSQWCDFLLEQFQEELKAKGFEDPEIHYSGFGSQGDGACFTCSKIDLEKWNSNYAGKGLFINITHSSHYYYASSTDIIVSDDSDALNADETATLEKMLEKERTDLGNDFYKRLEEFWMNMQNDEQVKETIEANEYEFTSDGMLFYQK